MVGGVHQRQQFTRGVGCADGGQLRFGTGLQLFTQAAHGARGALHHHHHDQRNHRHQHGLALQGGPQDLLCQGVAQLQRFGHLDYGHAPPLCAGDGLQQHGHTHVGIAKPGVVKVHQGGIGWPVGNFAAPERQLGVARHHLAAEAGDAVVHAALVVGFKSLQRRVGHQRTQLRDVVVPGDVELLADRLGRGQQGAVVGGVDRVERLVVEAEGVKYHQHSDGQQDADQQVAAQRQGARAALWRGLHVSLLSR